MCVHACVCVEGESVSANSKTAGGSVSAQGLRAPFVNMLNVISAPT